MAGYYLDCRREWDGDVVRVLPSGYLNDQTEGEFEAFLREASDCSPRLVLDASGLIHISSIGFGTLLSFAAGLRAAGGDLRLASLNPSMQRALRLAFGDYLRVFETAFEAVRSYDLRPACPEGAAW